MLTTPHSIRYINKVCCIWSCLLPAPAHCHAPPSAYINFTSHSSRFFIFMRDDKHIYLLPSPFSVSPSPPQPPRAHDGAAARVSDAHAPREQNVCREKCPSSPQVPGMLTEYLCLNCKPHVGSGDGVARPAFFKSSILLRVASSDILAPQLSPNQPPRGSRPAVGARAFSRGCTTLGSFVCIVG